MVEYLLPPQYLSSTDHYSVGIGFQPYLYTEDLNLSVPVPLSPTNLPADFDWEGFLASQPTTSDSGQANFFNHSAHYPSILPLPTTLDSRILEASFEASSVTSPSVGTQVAPVSEHNTQVFTAAIKMNVHPAQPVADISPAANLRVAHTYLSDVFSGLERDTDVRLPEMSTSNLGNLTDFEGEMEGAEGRVGKLRERHERTEIQKEKRRISDVVRKEKKGKVDQSLEVVITKIDELKEGFANGFSLSDWVANNLVDGPQLVKGNCAYSVRDAMISMKFAEVNSSELDFVLYSWRC